MKSRLDNGVVKQSNKTDSPNILLVTMDSCRWDSYENANMAFINAHCPARKAYSQATFTYASHLAMFQGVFPGTRERLPYYNRHVKQLIRIANRPTSLDSLFCFPSGTEDLITGFRDRGYFTLGIGAMEWFRHSHLTRNFQEFVYTGIHGKRQMDVFIEKTSGERPFFALLNFGETHDPYKIGQESKVPHTPVSRARRLNLQNVTFDKDGWLDQSACCEYIDTCLSVIFDHLKGIGRDTIFIVCGDHGECFGEEGMYGHGFYHPKVMEVPLAIFNFDGELTA